MAEAWANANKLVDYPSVTQVLGDAARVQSESDSMNRAAQGVLAEAKKTLGEIDEIKNNAQVSAGLTGVSSQIEVFRREARHNGGWGVFWGILTLLFGAFAIFFVNGGLDGVFGLRNGALGNQYEFYFAISRKIAVLVILGGVFFQSLKSLNASLHLRTLNLHRANCLQVVKLHLDSITDDKELREDVLRLAVPLIFAQGDTGFINAKAPTEWNFGDIQKLLPVKIPQV